jgi:hypothetical protein
LDARWSVHKAPSNDTNSRLLFEEYGIETCSILLLEEVKEDERVIKERWWIENTENVVNLRIDGRTIKEWFEDHPGYRQEYNKAYREKNRERLNAYDKERNTVRTPCPKCGKLLRRDSIRKHLKAMHL